MQNPFLIGERVYLRLLEHDDASLLVRWLQDTEVTQTLGAFSVRVDVEGEADFIEHLYQAGHDLLLGIVLKADERLEEHLNERLIGAIELEDLDLDNHHCSLGLFIGDRREWGNGYGAEAVELLLSYAFVTLRMNRVWLHVDEHNGRALRSYAKLGFQREGLLRQDRYYAGRYVNTVVMAVLREEWETLGQSATGRHNGYRRVEAYQGKVEHALFRRHMACHMAGIGRWCLPSSIRTGHHS